MTDTPLAERAEALVAIILRRPDLSRQAEKALAAARRGSPIAAQRIVAVVADALRGDSDDFTAEERDALRDLARAVATGAGPRGRVLPAIRVTDAERARVDADAAAAGQTVSDYIRARLGL